MDHHSTSHGKQSWLNIFRIATMLFLLLSAFGPAQAQQVYADKLLVCGIPGKDGPASISGVVNTYYPGAANVAAGSTSIPVGSASGASTPIAAGDLLLVIQMQGADINSTNTDAYGDGVGGGKASGNLAANFTAGQYEYVVATSAVVAGSVSISSGLVNSYFQQNYPVGAGNQGQRRFQVIRIPQYSSAVVTGTVTSPAWNGSVGGVVALDVAGTLNLNTNGIDVTGQGFRGGGGIRYTGTTDTVADTDYRTLSTVTANASKGEGTAGTPRLIYTGSSVTDFGVGQEGYPNGSFARGAPGNAGGGATDGRPQRGASAANDENAGGGGGANGGAGGDGGFAWFSVDDSGGYGGAAFPASASRMVLGGGGGAGSIDDNDGVLSSGSAGGGIVMVRAGTVTGSGTINANGSAAPGQTLNDSGGGGGAGGSVLVLAANGALPVGLNINANGGRGGDAWPGVVPGAYPGNRHGPGGGGGGGVIFVSSTAGALSVAGGQNGITTNAVPAENYGAEPGANGFTSVTTPSNVTTGISGAECIPTPTVVKTTSTPVLSQTPAGAVGTYTIVVSVPAGDGTAQNFTISDNLPAGFTYASTVEPVGLSGGATRVSVANPSPGTQTPSWGTFNIPGGGQVTITFNVNIAASVATGVSYDNPATATYLDPTRTTQNGTTDSVYDHLNNPGENIILNAAALPDLTVTKVNNVSGSVQPNSPFTWTINVTNNGGAVAFTAGQTILRDALPGQASYYGAVNLDTGSASGPLSCTIVGMVLSCVANGGIVTIPSGASFSVNLTVTPTAGGLLQNTAIVDPDGIITETNENNNTATDAVNVLGVDLSIVKDDGQTSYLAPSTVIYTVTVRNNSGASVTGATVSDARPTNITNWSWVCTTSPATAGCTGAALSSADFTDTVNLEPSEQIVYTVTANVSANATGNLVNTATVAVPAGYVDTNTANNTSTDTDTLTVQSVDLSINKTDSQLTYSAGGTVTYTVTVQNLSNVNVTNATVSDPIPANVSSWAWACTSGNATCTPAGSSSSNFTDTVDLPANSSIVYTVTANIVASPSGDLVNTATVTPPTGIADSNPSNNSSTDTDTLLAANLSITKTDNRTSYLGSDTITYQVTVVNLGSVDVPGAVISDPKPSNIASWAWACTGGTGANCTPAGSSSADFSDTVDLDAGETIVYTVTAIVVANPTGDLVNTATVSLPSGYTDTDPADNTSTDTDVLGPAANLSLIKTVNNTTPAVLSNITFTISATNTGPDPATGVVVTENLPSGFTYVSSTTNPNTTTYSNVTGLWTIGNMAVNETVTLTITATVNLTGSYVNTAEITASLLIDPNSTPNNNNPAEDDQASVTIVPNFGNDPDPDPDPTPRQPTTTTVQPVVTGFLIPVTGFAPNKVTPLNTDSKPVYQPTDLRIEIPTVNVNLPVVGVDFRKGNWDVSWLQDQAGWLAGTSYPTWNGNSVLTAHSVNKNGKPGAFSNLKYLAKGEYIFVYADGYRYTYQVVSNKLLQPTDASVLKHEDKSFLTLITCDTYDEASGAYLLRTVVKAALVDVATVK